MSEASIDTRVPDAAVIFRETQRVSLTFQIPLQSNEKTLGKAPPRKPANQKYEAGNVHALLPDRHA